MAVWYPGDFSKLLLDSSLITPVKFKKYTFKVIKCGDYLQVFRYKETKVIKDKEPLDNDKLYHKKSSCRVKDKIEYRNIMRTKFTCQRLAKANAKEWKSFITLTYADNMQDIPQAKKDFEYFVTNIKKKKPDFKYISIIEFQKRGAVHFHLLSNLSLNDTNIIVKQKDNDKYCDVKHWKKGFTSFESVEGDIKKIIGYISKYMTKECDDRLFNYRRFSSSQNLLKPEVNYISFRNDKERKWLYNEIKGREGIYTSTYFDKFDNEVYFTEFLRN